MLTTPLRPTFPSTCLSPDQPGYGQVVASGPNRRRMRRSAQATPAVPSAPRETHVNWTVVTPSSAINTHQSISQQPYSPTATIVSSPVNAHSHGIEHHQHQHHHHAHQHNGYQYPTPTNVYPQQPPLTPHSPSQAPSALTSTSREQRGGSSSIRYSPYSSHAVIPHRRSSGTSSSSRGHGIQTTDIPPLSTREYPPSQSRGGAPPLLPRPSISEPITLPPVRPHLNAGSSHLPYALPPISALEDLRGVHNHDSAAVLRRLKAEDDESMSELDRLSDDEQVAWARRRASPIQPNFK